MEQKSVVGGPKPISKTGYGPGSNLKSYKVFFLLVSARTLGNSEKVKVPELFRLLYTLQ